MAPEEGLAVKHLTADVARDVLDASVDLHMGQKTSFVLEGLATLRADIFFGHLFLLVTFNVAHNES